MGQEYSTIVLIIVKADRGKAIFLATVTRHYAVRNLPLILASQQTLVLCCIP